MKALLAMPAELPGHMERGDIMVTSATEANAVPVAEFTLAQILLAVCWKGFRTAVAYPQDSGR